MRGGVVVWEDVVAERVVDGLWVRLVGGMLGDLRRWVGVVERLESGWIGFVLVLGLVLVSSGMNVMGMDGVEWRKVVVVGDVVCGICADEWKTVL